MRGGKDSSGGQILILGQAEATLSDFGDFERASERASISLESFTELRLWLGQHQVEPRPPRSREEEAKIGQLWSELRDATRSVFV